MYIQVLVSHITYNPIIEYYNTHKEENEEPLQVLNRMDGGFYISLPKPAKGNYGFIDFNDCVRQVRWDRKRLCSTGFIGFTDKQTKLLYESMVHALGEPNVILIK
jgi:hypothetical protein